jgi:hypothetical protein
MEENGVPNEMLTPEPKPLSLNDKQTLIAKALIEFAEGPAPAKYFGEKTLKGKSFKNRTDIESSSDIFHDEMFLQGVLMKEVITDSKGSTEAQIFTRDSNAKYNRVMYEALTIGGTEEWQKFNEALKQGNEYLYEYGLEKEQEQTKILEARFDFFKDLVGNLEGEELKGKIKLALDTKIEEHQKLNPNSREAKIMQKDIDSLKLFNEKPEQLKSLKEILKTNLNDAKPDEKWQTLTKFTGHFDQERMERYKQIDKVVKFYNICDMQQSQERISETLKNTKETYVTSGRGDLEYIVDISALSDAHFANNQKLAKLKSSIEESAKAGGWISDQLVEDTKQFFQELAPEKVKHIKTIHQEASREYANLKKNNNHTYYKDVVLVQITGDLNKYKSKLIKAPSFKSSLESMKSRMLSEGGNAIKSLSEPALNLKKMMTQPSLFIKQHSSSLSNLTSCSALNGVSKSKSCGSHIR